MYKIVFTKQAIKDVENLKRAGLYNKAKELVSVLITDPFQPTQSYESLKGDKKGSHSRRINKQHRLVYEILPNVEKLKTADGVEYKGIIKVIRMWTHYE
ncbi:MAG: Txe/YoeB family addiction module toxin [Defluviitaleaceae bacterium]|nr:Txe/YoeB family addiction module toxin [Defluviitaleaceae bacterium]